MKYWTTTAKRLWLATINVVISGPLNKLARWRTRLNYQSLKISMLICSYKDKKVVNVSCRQRTRPGLRPNELISTFYNPTPRRFEQQQLSHTNKQQPLKQLFLLRNLFVSRLLERMRWSTSWHACADAQSCAIVVVGERTRVRRVYTFTAGVWLRSAGGTRWSGAKLYKFVWCW